MYTVFFKKTYSFAFPTFFQFFDTSAEEPKEVEHVKAWMKMNKFALVADMNGGGLVAR